MVQASCHCGAVELDLAEAPSEVTDCNCSICRRYGILWAYYSPRQVEIRAREGTDTYLWGTRSTIFHRCRNCGCVTHWSAADPRRDRMGVNARMLAPEILDRAQVHHLDGADTDEYLD